MKKKKKNLFQARYIVLFIMIVVSGICIKAVYEEVNTTFSLKAEIGESKRIKTSLKEQKEDLKLEKENLNNPEYIVRYARGKYMVTKENGEQVFKLPTKEK